MTPGPYEQYELIAREEADRKYKKWTLPLMGFGAAICAVIGYFVAAGEIVGVAAGAAIGVFLGYVIQFGIRRTSAGNAAETRYRADWCAENGCTVIGVFEPPNGPFADSGHRQRSSDAIQGTINGLPTVLYNFSYWTRQSNSKGSSTETEHPYKILCITGATLPAASLSFSERGALNRFRVFDKLDSALTSQRGVELESIEFNQKFDLEVNDGADDVWVRRIFDPSTIDALVKGSEVIPDLRYYDQTFWLVGNGHYEARELDTMKAWQGTAVAGISILTRVSAT
ncbi:MAG: hypothetical protein HY827_04805 [Actinobacteria bacterium]|nr:hypothetical protein [Actinomycetota bacterium]